MEILNQNQSHIRVRVKERTSSLNQSQKDDHINRKIIISQNSLSLEVKTHERITSIEDQNHNGMVSVQRTLNHDMF